MALLVSGRFETRHSSRLVSLAVVVLVGRLEHIAEEGADFPVETLRSE